MTNLTMRTVVYRVTGIRRKTKAKFFQDVKVGDYLQVYFDLSGYWSSSYVIQVNVKNMLTGQVTSTSINGIHSMLEKFELQETKLESNDVVDMGKGILAISADGVAKLHGESGWVECDEYISAHPTVDGRDFIYVDEYLRWLEEN